MDGSCSSSSSKVAGCDKVVPRWAKPLDGGKFDEPALSSSSGKNSNEVDRLGNKRSWDGYNRLLHQLLEAA